MNRVTGLMWWIDRWRTSAAYTEMTLEEQGAYRNLLDEATLRGGVLPNDPRVLAKACGDVRRWPKLRAAVLRRFRRDADGWRNKTLDGVLEQTARRMDEREAWREKKAGQRGGHTGGQPRGQTGGQDRGQRPYLNLDLDLEVKNPPTPLRKGGRLTRADLQLARETRTRVHGGCPHDPRCPTATACIERLAHDAKARAC